MTTDNGGDPQDEVARIAPVIPLFGSAASTQGETAPAAPETGPFDHPSERGSSAAAIVPRRTGDSGLWRSTWDGEGPSATEGTPSERHPARGGRGATSATPPASRLRALRPHETSTDPGGEETDHGQEQDPTRLREAAEEALVRKLRGRSLSVSEARTVLRGHSLPAAQVDEVIDDFSRRGYLDDLVLAGHLVTSGSERKGQGRVAIARVLAQRGIPRDVIDSALSELPDDDADRALEYARTKARSLSRLDFDTALRRLVGQLARRGYGGSVAMTAARTALTGSAARGTTSGVRFEESDE